MGRAWRVDVVSRRLVRGQGFHVTAGVSMVVGLSGAEIKGQVAGLPIRGTRIAHRVHLFVRSVRCGIARHVVCGDDVHLQEPDGFRQRGGLGAVGKRGAVGVGDKLRQVNRKIKRRICLRRVAAQCHIRKGPRGIAELRKRGIADHMPQAVVGIRLQIVVLDKICKPLPPAAEPYCLQKPER